MLQICVSLFPLLSTKEDIGMLVTNVGNQTVAGSQWLPQYGKSTMKDNGYR